MFVLGLVGCLNTQVLAFQHHVRGSVYGDGLGQIAVGGDPSGTVNPAPADQVRWAMQDANFNVLGVVDESGVLTERYEYTPYGQRTVFFTAGANDAGAYSPAYVGRRAVLAQLGDQPYAVCDVGHQGLVHDEEIGLAYNRARHLHPSVGSFVQRDPLAYIDGTNLYTYIVSNPLRALDPFGAQHSPGVAVAVAAGKVATARAALKIAIGLGGVAAISQKRAELETALRELSDLIDSISVFGTYEVAETVRNEADESAKLLAAAGAIILASSQADAVEHCESVQVQIDVHLDKLVGGNPDPGGPWDHWVREIKGWIKQQQDKLKRMGRKTRERWEEQIRANLERLREQMNRKNDQFTLTASAAKDELTPYPHNGKTVTGEIIFISGDGRRHIWRTYSDGSKTHDVE